MLASPHLERHHGAGRCALATVCIVCLAVGGGEQPEVVYVGDVRVGGQAAGDNLRIFGLFLHAEFERFEAPQQQPAGMRGNHIAEKSARTFLGNMIAPHTGWLLLRSLETLKLRMEKQAENAQVVARRLAAHPNVANVHYLGLLTPADGEAYDTYRRQCTSPGAMVSFEVRGGEHEAFVFLNNLKIVKLAVSLGSTESLAQHPATMTHAGVNPAEKAAFGITDALIRLSVGVENAEDLWWDLEQALDKISLERNGIHFPKPAGQKAVFPAEVG